jgi:hypothetical protein
VCPGVRGGLCWTGKSIDNCLVELIGHLLLSFADSAVVCGHGALGWIKWTENLVGQVILCHMSEFLSQRSTLVVCNMTSADGLPWQGPTHASGTVGDQGGEEKAAKQRIRSQKGKSNGGQKIKKEVDLTFSMLDLLHPCTHWRILY